MTDHDLLTRRLDALAERLVDDPAPPSADVVWRAGSRRRRRERALAATAAVAVLAVLVGGLLPGRGPSAALPADRPAPPLASFPSHVALWGVPRTGDAPGVSALVVSDASQDPTFYAVAPGGALTRLGHGEPGEAGPALSPDGRWLQQGSRVRDLVTGTDVLAPAEREAWSRSRMPTDRPGLWSPDSTRVYVPSMAQGSPPRAAGVVVGTDGTLVDVPFVRPAEPTEGAGLDPVVAGWLDDRTLLAAVDEGAGAPLVLLRWSLGDRAWVRTGAEVSWIGGGQGLDEPALLRLQLSPDAQRLLVMRFTPPSGDPDSASPSGETTGMMFSPDDGRQLGMPTADPTRPGGVVLDATMWAAGTGYGWDGDCAVVWRDGLPILRDGTELRAFVTLEPDPLRVTLSDRLDGCVLAAGNALVGTRVGNGAAVWAERAWVYGSGILMMILLMGLTYGLGVRLRRPLARFLARRRRADPPPETGLS